ncbi:hypothetical protein JTE90_024538 [Oedothorax gibbosus]|uniref:Uncharacterized protein n=1 Tax=Oedothorax gibbosus TaxID=931172 RepID=A0AAV6VER6_9ARAC|nr:hypothetical protein JTE90_024538 [Oedothorax gibbosus]
MVDRMRFIKMAEEMEGNKTGADFREDSEFPDKVRLGGALSVLVYEDIKSELNSVRAVIIMWIDRKWPILQA